MLLAAPTISDRFTTTRALTESLAGRLSPEDQTPQSMPDASPTKWHRAHVTWFFEEFILRREAGFVEYDPAYRYLFNSYYEAVGPRHPRPQRGLVTRPGIAEIAGYRAAVEEQLLNRLDSGALDEPAPQLGESGCNHEQNHQELLLMDAKHLLSTHPFAPVYVERPADEPAPVPPLTWRAVRGGLVEVGHDGAGFAFDNEGPRHLVHLADFEIAERAVTNADWLEFMADGGYGRPELWLSDGWAHVRSAGWSTGSSRTGSGRRSPSPGGARSCSPNRSATSRSTRRTRSPAGPVPGCPPSRSGRSPRVRSAAGARNCSTRAGAIPAWPGRR